MTLRDVLAVSEPTQNIEISPELRKQIKERAKEKRVVTLRLEDRQIKLAKAITERKGIPYQTLIRSWVEEAIRRETLY